MASTGDGNDVTGKFVVAEALTRLGGSLARYDVKLVAGGGYLTYVEAYVPPPPGPGSAAAAEAGRVLVRCAGGVSLDLGESEESGAGAFLRALGDRYGARVDEAELRRALDVKKRIGLLRYEHIMTFDVEDCAAGDLRMCTEGISRL